MDSKEYKNLLNKELQKEQEKKALVKQEMRLERAKEIRKNVKKLKSFFSVFTPGWGGCDRYRHITSIKMEATVDILYADDDRKTDEQQIIVNNVPISAAKKFIEMYIDILNKEFKRL